MLRNITRLQLRPRFIRSFATTRQNNNKVCVIGAAGGIGQPLSLLLKVNPLVTDLALYDLKAATGVAMDISHIDTGGKVAGYCGLDNLKYALNCSQLVIIVAGVPRKPGMERSDLFKVNAKMVADIMPIFAKVSPQAFLIIVTNPVNSLVPLAGEMLQKAGVFDPKRLFGASSLDVIRARTFTGEEGMIDPRKIKIDVVGGHSNLTILPLYSTLKPTIRNWDEENFEKLINRIQEAGAAVVAAKGTGSATLAIAYAVERFSNSLMMGLDGAGNIPVEYAFVFSDGNSSCEYFAHPLRLGKEGIKENLGIPPLSAMEAEMMKCLIPILNKDIEMGKEFAKKLPPKKDDC